jgi:hypothetical protein
MALKEDDGQGRQWPGAEGDDNGARVLLMLSTACSCCRCRTPQLRTGVFTDTDDTVTVTVAASGCSRHITETSLDKKNVEHETWGENCSITRRSSGLSLRRGRHFGQLEQDICG